MRPAELSTTRSNGGVSPEGGSLDPQISSFPALATIKQPLPKGPKLPPTAAFNRSAAATNSLNMLMAFPMDTHV